MTIESVTKRFGIQTGRHNIDEAILKARARYESDPSYAGKLLEEVDAFNLTRMGFPYIEGNAIPDFHPSLCQARAEQMGHSSHMHQDYSVAISVHEVLVEHGVIYSGGGAPTTKTIDRRILTGDAISLWHPGASWGRREMYFTHKDTSSSQERARETAA